MSWYKLNVSDVHTFPYVKISTPKSSDAHIDLKEFIDKDYKDRKSVV